MLDIIKSQSCTIHDSENVKGFFGKYSFLSNFQLGEVYFEGYLYPSSENAYQAAKSIDQKIRNQFITITPSQSKKLGRKITIREDWDSVKIKIMSDICFDKFTRHQNFQDKLIETGDKYLEETNYWNDKFWGVCNGVGQNNLGKILMDIRTYLKQ